jgi:hypothetical protein
MVVAVMQVLDTSVTNVALPPDALDHLLRAVAVRPIHAPHPRDSAAPPRAERVEGLREPGGEAPHGLAAVE